MTRDSQGPWLTSKEAAALLRVHPKHIYRLLGRGLPAQRVGGQWRFTSSELHLWAQRSRSSLSEVQESNNKLQLSTGVSGASRLLASSGDIAVELLLAEVNRKHPATLGSLLDSPRAALPLLDNGEVLAVAWLGEYSDPHSGRWARVHIAYESVGLAGPWGRAAPVLADLTRSKMRLASWDPSADVRRVLDGILAREGVDPVRAHRSAILHNTHAQVVSSVLRGEAGAAVTTASWAQRAGLPFLALGSRPLGLIVAVAALADAALIRCWEVLQSVSWQDAVSKAGGFDCANAGSITYFADTALAAPKAGAAIRRGSSAARSGRPAVASDATGPRFAILTRSSGSDTSHLLAVLLRGLERHGLQVAGFQQLPHKIHSRLVGYDLKRLGRSSRVQLARRVASVQAGEPSRFVFRKEGFAQALAWLEEDCPAADIAILDALGSLEAQGKGHFRAIAFASQTTALKVCLLCVRSEHLPRILQRLGRPESCVARIDAKACGEEAPRRAFLEAIARIVKSSVSTSNSQGESAPTS